MDAVDVARWQFAITTVYHFLFVPITIGLSLVVAIFHTQWVRTRNPEYYRLTKFFGKLFIINFALGLVTGIVQEFQFGMNWSDYSRFVGDIFGAPLAFEALLAFFLESTFLGIWIFGWGRIPEKLHAGTMWLVHIGTVLSAYFILAANSFMQNPVGFRFNPATAAPRWTTSSRCSRTRSSSSRSRTSSPRPTWSAAPSSWASRSGCCASTPDTGDEHVPQGHPLRGGLRPRRLPRRRRHR